MLHQLKCYDGGTMSEIEKFISDFKQYERSHVLFNTFSYGYCYYFAVILKARFPQGEIMYHHTNHYMLGLGGRLYDITGDCTDKYDDNMLCKWDELNDEDSLLYNRLVRDCIIK